MINMRESYTNTIGNTGEASAQKSVGELPIEKVNRYNEHEFLSTMKEVHYSELKAFNLFSGTKAMIDGWTLSGNSKLGFILTKGDFKLRFDIRISTKAGCVWVGCFKRTKVEVGATAVSTTKRGTKMPTLPAHEEMTKATAKALGWQLTKAMAPCESCAKEKGKQKNVNQESKGHKADGPGEKLFIDIKSKIPPADPYDLFEDIIPLQSWGDSDDDDLRSVIDDPIQGTIFELDRSKDHNATDSSDSEDDDPEGETIPAEPGKEELEPDPGEPEDEDDTQTEAVDNRTDEENAEEEDGETPRTRSGRRVQNTKDRRDNTDFAFNAYEYSSSWTPSEEKFHRGREHAENELSMVGATGDSFEKTQDLKVMKYAEAGLVKVIWRKGDEMAADLFTKNLAGPLFETHASEFVGEDEYFQEHKSKKEKRASMKSQDTADTRKETGFESLGTVRPFDSEYYRIWNEIVDHDDDD